MDKWEMREMTPEEKGRKGLFTVLLTSAGNPDFGEDPDRPLPGTPTSRAGAFSIQEASELCTRYIGKYGLGGGNWTGGEVLDTAGTLVARISFNGRCWLPSADEIKEYESTRTGVDEAARATLVAVNAAIGARQSRKDGKGSENAERAHLSGSRRLSAALQNPNVRDARCIHAEYGTRTTPDNPLSMTPLIYLMTEASRHSYGPLADLIKVAIESGCDPSVGCDAYGAAALHIAAEDGCTDLAEMLLDAGADIEGRDRNGRSALHLAAITNRVETATMLIARGAPIGAKDEYGCTPMSLACKSSMINALLDAGASPRDKDHLNQTPLHKRIDHKTVKRLIDAGADIGALDYAGNSPLHIFAHSKASVVELIKAGAEVDRPNKSGQTPLSISVHGDDSLPRVNRRSSPAAAEVLLLNGAELGFPVSKYQSETIRDAALAGKAAHGFPRDFDFDGLRARWEAACIYETAESAPMAIRKRI